MESRLAELKDEILRIQTERNLEFKKHQTAIYAETLKLKELSKLYHQRSKAFLRDSSIRRYAPFVKANNIPTCVHVLQASQLRSLHQMCVLDYQKRLVDKHSSRMISAMRRAIAKMADEKTHVDVQMLNTMVRVQSEEQAMQQSYESILLEQSTQLEFFQDVVQGIEMERSLNGGFDDSMGGFESDGIAELKDAPSTSSLQEQTHSQQQTPQPRRSRHKKLTLGDMLQKGDLEQQSASSFHTSVTVSSDEGSMSSFLSQSFSNTFWKDKRNRVDLI